MFEGIFGSIVWILANALYIDMRRKGRSGWSRFILFWMGLPLTWLWLFLVREGSAPEIEEPPDDAEALLAEIRRERRLSAGASRQDSEDLQPPSRLGDSAGRGEADPPPSGDGP